MKELMLGNKALARGLYEAGCSVVSSYPGTPSTEVPRNATGKIEKPALRKKYGAERLVAQQNQG